MKDNLRSAFDLRRQNSKIESRIVVALERVSEAFRVLLWAKSKENGLSPIQNQILIFCLFHAEEQCKVSYLAREFNMTKPTVSDSVKVLERKGMIEKYDDPADTRSYIIGLTDEGRQVAEEVSGFALALERPLHRASEEQKQVMLTVLLQLIHDLQRAGVIGLQRMCFTCAHYRRDAGGHYCQLLKTRLADEALRVDCPEHEGGR